jgi:hypothetical protein
VCTCTYAGGLSHPKALAISFTCRPWLLSTSYAPHCFPCQTFHPLLALSLNMSVHSYKRTCSCKCTSSCKQGCSIWGSCHLRRLLAYMHLNKPLNKLTNPVCKCTNSCKFANSCECTYSCKCTSVPILASVPIPTHASIFPPYLCTHHANIDRVIRPIFSALHALPVHAQLGKPREAGGV